MGLVELLSIHVGASLAKFLLKSYLGEPTTAVGAGLIDIAKKKIEGYRDRKETERQFERIGERIVDKLVPLFEHETSNKGLNFEAIAIELGKALEGRLDAEFFLLRDLDPKKLISAFHGAHKLAPGYSEAETTIYDRALTEAVRYLVEVVPQLPSFVPMQVAQSLQRLTSITAAIDELAERFAYIERAIEVRETDNEARRYELEYRLAVLRNLDYMELFGADLRPESMRQQLSAAYVSLNVQSIVEGEDEEMALPVEMVLDRLSPESGRLLIRGEAGCGKSTLLRWSALQAAEFCGFRRSQQAFLDPESKDLIFEDWPEEEKPTLMRSWRTCVPFLVRLRDCQDGKLPSPEEFPNHIAKEIGGSPKAWVVSVLRANRGLVLLDGVDEIPNLHRDTILHEINSIVGAYPGNIFIVSTRPEAVPKDWLASLDFEETRVNPLSNLDRERLIDRWHDAVAAELESLGRPADNLSKLATDLKQELNESPNMARLATNSLLCAMTCALHRDRGQKLPESQAKLCEALCEMLLHRRERESGLDLSEYPEPYIKLSYDQKRAILQEIAQFMLLEESSTIRLEHARKKTAEVLRSVPGQAEENALVVCRVLVERSGMLREARPEHLDFIHNTFKEYLAADHFAEAQHVKFLSGRAFDSTWQRVLLFAVATPQRKFASEVIRHLLGSTSGSHTRPRISLRERRLLALRCRSVAEFIDPDLDDELNHVAARMFPPRNMAVAEALAAGGNAAVPYLVLRKRWKTETAAACVRCLRLIGTRMARNVLEGYRAETRRKVLLELAQALNPLTFEMVQESLLRTGKIDGRFLTQIPDFSVLGYFAELRELSLSNTEIGDVSPIRGLVKLRSLFLQNTKISDISALTNLVNLEVLFLQNSKVENIAALENLTQLRELSLAGTRVADVSPLAGLVDLGTLTLSDTKVSDLSPLANLSSLRSLYIKNTNVSDVSPLASLSKLHIVT